MKKGTTGTSMTIHRVSRKLKECNCTKCKNSTNLIAKNWEKVLYCNVFDIVKPNKKKCNRYELRK